jgi:hypothetical protein
MIVNESIKIVPAGAEHPSSYKGPFDPIAMSKEEVNKCIENIDTDRLNMLCDFDGIFLRVLRLRNRSYIITYIMSVYNLSNEE